MRSHYVNQPISYLRCEACATPSHGKQLCGECSALIEAHLNGLHQHLVPECPECLLIAE